MASRQSACALFQELTDEIAINTQARQNLMFAVEEKPLASRIELSQSKDELILKCSFNQGDCHLERFAKFHSDNAKSFICSDFKLHYDPTYGEIFLSQ